MDIRKGKLLYEGKTKKLYPTNNPDYLVIHFKDDAFLPHKDKKKTIKNKGTFNNAISSSLFKFLESYNVHTHFVKVLKSNEMLVKKLGIIPVEVMVWNFAAGSMRKRFGLEKEALLSFPILEFYLKNAKLNNPMITVDHACAFGYASLEEMQNIDRITRKINAVLKSYLDRRELKLVVLKLEFGRCGDQVLIGDEISPDTFQFWDIRAGEAMNKDPLCLESDDVEAAYKALKNRICS